MRNFKEAKHDEDFYDELWEASKVILNKYQARAFAYFEQVLIKNAASWTYRGDLILLFFKKEIYGEELFDKLSEIGQVDESEMDRLIQYGEAGQSLEKELEHISDIMFEECDNQVYLKEFKCQFEKFLNLYDEELKENKEEK